MAKFICELEGNRGRNLKLYDTKIIITTKKTVGSFLTGNITDGEKTIYLCDITGVQFKRSGLLIGYLQFETTSMQMNNQDSNFFSENTFTYAVGSNGITVELMEAFYTYITDRIEELKYGTKIIIETPDFESMKIYKNTHKNTEQAPSQHEFQDIKIIKENTIELICPKCKEELSFFESTKNAECPFCGTPINL
jgi:uncharacterized CHY-type Zn-finger protein